jgi:hypothetical protein
VQVALGRGQLGVTHHVLDGDEVELLDRQAAEAVAQVVEAAYTHARLFLSAEIDEVRVYSRALSGAEITADKEAQVGQAASDPTKHERLTDAGVQLELGEAELAQAQEETPEDIVAVIAPPIVRDADGQIVPVYLEVAADTIILRIEDLSNWEDIGPEESDFHYPLFSAEQIMALGGASSGSPIENPHCLARAHKIWMEKRLEHYREGSLGLVDDVGGGHALLECWLGEGAGVHTTS